nr:DUF4124 domain-containing protein [Acinetobacter sp. HR7]
MLCISLMGSNAMANEFYKWVDAKGVTHYTKTPPPKNAKKTGKVETYGWKNSYPTPSHSTAPAADSKSAKEENSAPVEQNQSQPAAQPATSGKML